MVSQITPESPYRNGKIIYFKKTSSSFRFNKGSFDGNVVFDTVVSSSKFIEVKFE